MAALKETVGDVESTDAQEYGFSADITQDNVRSISAHKSEPVAARVLARALPD
ncbi:MAG TPA: hypothetical protein VK446_14280 [Methylocystis sp.]|nr:hypothetical protein [Methylocystis sp.]